MENAKRESKSILLYNNFKTELWVWNKSEVFKRNIQKTINQEIKKKKVKKENQQVASSVCLSN